MQFTWIININFKYVTFVTIFFSKKKYRENKTDEQKQKQKDYQKKYKENMTDEQKKNI